MITIITSHDCIQFNFESYDKERMFCDILTYHKQNNTGKSLKIKSIQFDGGEKLINPCDVIECQQEDRKYDIRVGNAIDELIGGLF